MSIIVLYLAECRGQRDEYSRIINVISPPSLTESPEKHQIDAKHNLNSAIEIGLATREADRIELRPDSTTAARQGVPAIMKLIRQRILSEELNTGTWGQQTGVRDLTNALAWFLTFEAQSAPARMEGGPPSVVSSQEADFGPRYDEGDDTSNWPISNNTRWNAFQRWACSLGFAWRAPSGRLVPDPTPAVRDSITAVFGDSSTLDGRSFIAALAAEIPVLETGTYRRFVEKNLRREPGADNVLSAATTDALLRLRSSQHIVLEDRADAPRVTCADGSTFSHMSIGRHND